MTNKFLEMLRAIAADATPAGEDDCLVKKSLITDARQLIAGYEAATKTAELANKFAGK